MRLLLNNFAKIREADINIDGIAVIVGLNNSGKSTVGKALDTIFASATDIKNKMNDSRTNMIQNSIEKVLDTIDLDVVPFGAFSVNDSIIKSVINSFKVGMSDTEIKRILSENIDGIGDEYFFENVTSMKEYAEKRKSIIDLLTRAIRDVVKVGDAVFERRIITNQFDEAFNGNINCVSNDNESLVSLNIKDKNITCRFLNNTCFDFQANLTLKNRSFYMWIPFIIDKLNTS